MNRKITSKKLLALCSAAVVCASGYAVVQSAMAAPSSQTHNSTAAASVANHKTTNKATTAKTVKKPIIKQKYKDGTYKGVGTTQIGAVQVAVSLKKDKITKVQITDYSTHYPISYIDPILPQELMSRQNINKIDVISGATLSTEDFYYAVVSCLQEAQKAEKTATSSQSHA